ncbi:unnamed protein product [Ilex paraguariensis]|uniref:Uncharacterized protein n=1 Tax=Ilex paraguariensis TaxID=185542 RepID=A0ABC8UMN8_9AQUA
MLSDQCYSSHQLKGGIDQCSDSTQATKEAVYRGCSVLRRPTRNENLVRTQHCSSSHQQQRGNERCSGGTQTSIEYRGCYVQYSGAFKRPLSNRPISLNQSINSTHQLSDVFNVKKL